MSARKTAFWLQIAEYLMFCTRDYKDVHNALRTTRKMDITNTNIENVEIQIQKYKYKIQIQNTDCKKKVKNLPS